MKNIISKIVVFVLSFGLFAENLGLVLSGGGAKGAYEVGVWKAMEEYGLTYDTKVISGASVGALNAALFACANAETAEKLWREQAKSTNFLDPDSIDMEEAAKFAVRNAKNNYGIRAQEEDPFGINDKLDESASAYVNNVLNFLTYLGDVTVGVGKSALKFAGDYISSLTFTDGIFDKETLEAMLKDYISLQKIQKSNIDVYAAAVQKSGKLVTNTLAKLLGSTNGVEYFKLNEQADDRSVQNILLASSAFPFVYEAQTLYGDVVINGKPVGETYEYIDGGFEAAGGKNTPVEPAVFSSKVDKLFIVYLKSQEEMNESGWYSSVTEKELKGKPYIEIYPSEDLGDFFEGTANFQEGKIDYLINLGYTDGCNILENNGYKKMNKLQKFFKKFIK